MVEKDPLADLERLFRSSTDLRASSGSEGAAGRPAAPAARDAEAAAPGAEPAEEDAPLGPTLEELVSEVDAEMSGVAAVAAAERSSAVAAAPARTTPFVVFSVGATRFAIPLANVQEVGGVPPSARVPRVPAWIRGVANLRGDVLALVDVALLLEVPLAESPGGGRLLVVRLPEDDLTTGFLVDQVDAIAPIAEDALRESAAPIPGKAAAFLRGVAPVEDRLVAVLDLARLLRSPEMRSFEAA